MGDARSTVPPANFGFEGYGVKYGRRSQPRPARFSPSFWGEGQLLIATDVAPTVSQTGGSLSEPSPGFPGTRPMG